MATRAEEGIVRALNHGGDGLPGGADTDNAVVDGLVVPKHLDDYGLIACQLVTGASARPSIAEQADVYLTTSRAYRGTPIAVR